jgi:hypothetical protein
VEPGELPLETLISAARFAKYRAAARGNVDQAARLYMWNARLSSAYWPAIALLEVSIRNALNDRLCARLNCSPATGWHSDALSDRPRIHLVERDRDKLKKSIETFHRRQGGGPGQRAEPTGDDVVGGTSLGLWVALCGEGSPRQDPRYNYHRNLWRPGLFRAFPGYEGPSPADKPGPIRDALREFERLRNRIAHHEPIYMLNHTHQAENIEVLGSWINPSLSTYLAESDEVIAVAQSYQTAVLRS